VRSRTSGLRSIDSSFREGFGVEEARQVF
jgi:hypothetical protein